MGESSTESLHGLYEGLSRYQWFRRRLARAKPGERLEMHKTLAPPKAPPIESPSEPGRRPAGGTVGLNRWLFDRISLPESPRVLDIGCGFGATLFSWARGTPRRDGRFVGLTLSPFQVRKATAEAERLGLSDKCSFLVQSYDDPIEPPFDLPPFDVIVSIESLSHSPDLPGTLHNLAGAIRPGGTFAIVEDMARETLTNDPDARALRAAWTQAAVHSIDDFRAGLAKSGFRIERETDLTDQVRWRSSEALAANERRLRRVRKLTPWTGGRRALDAFLGGIALERLYASGRMGYHALFAVREEATSGH